MTDQETDAAAGFGGQLQAFGLGQIRILDFRHHGADPRLAQSFLSGPEPVVIAACPHYDQSFMIEAELAQARRKQIGIGCHPKNSSHGQPRDGFLPAEQGGKETGDCRQVADHVMDAAAQQAAARNLTVDLGHAHRNSRGRDPAARPGHTGELIAQLLNRGRVDHALMNTRA